MGAYRRVSVFLGFSDISEARWIKLEYFFHSKVNKDAERYKIKMSRSIYNLKTRLLLTRVAGSIPKAAEICCRVQRRALV